MDHDDNDRRARDLQPPAGRPERDGRDRPRLDRLPPPYVPGEGQASRANRIAPELARGGSGIPDEAFISPDDPLPTSSPAEENEGRVPEEAFIDPDEPMVRSAARDNGFVGVETGGWDGEDADRDDAVEGVVTGIDDDPHLDDEERAAIQRYGDPYVVELVEMVGTLAKALRDKGQAGLHATAEMAPFEATLRAYCVGYLAGRRAESD